MFRRAPRRRRRSVPLAFQPLEPRLAMAGDFSLAIEGDAYAIKADDAKYAEVATFAKESVVAPLADLTKAPFLDAAGKQVVHLVDVHDRMKDVAAVKEAEQAGLGRDIDRESKIIDPATDEPLGVGRGKATSLVPGMPGGDGLDDLLGKGRKSRLTDPLTGQPLLGGDGSGDAGPSHDDAMAAGIAGKGRAMDYWVNERAKDRQRYTVTWRTPVVGAMSFGEAYIWGLGQPDGLAITLDDGTTFTFWSSETEKGAPKVTVLTEFPDGNGHIEDYVQGQVDWYPNDDKPRPDDDSGTPPRKLTEAEKLAIRKELRGGFGPAGQPRPDDDGHGAGGYNGDGGVLRYVDLAGQPRPDDEGHRGGVAPAGPVLTDVGLAGQPVDDDTNFGVIGPQFGSHLPPNPVFGS